MILPYFTTNDMTPMEVQDVGRKQLAMLYPLVSIRLLLLHSRPTQLTKRIAHPPFPGGLQYKRTGGCSSEILKKQPLTSTKILFSGRALKCFTPEITNSTTTHYLMSQFFGAKSLNHSFKSSSFLMEHRPPPDPIMSSAFPFLPRQLPLFQL